MLTHHEGVDVIYGLAVKGVYPSAVHAARYFHGLCELVNDAYKLGNEARPTSAVQDAGGGGT
jgi:hypothetical protein